MSSTEDIVGMHRRYVLPTYAPGLTLVRGEGARVWDADGREYLDFLAGIAVVGAGHCHPRVVEAVCRQAGRLMHVSNLFYNEMQPRLARALSERALGGACFFCNSGAEANEALIKLARLWGRDRGRYEVVSMRNSFHGRTLATLTATGQEKVQKGFEPLPEGFVLADFNDLDACRAAIGPRTAAVLVEPVQGEGGVVPAEAGFLEGLRALCDEQGVLLMMDEVQCGMGRTGKWFGYRHYAARPDAISLAKALGNGFPIGAIVTAPALSDVFAPGRHASTFGGTPLACAAALATIEAIEEEGMVENAAAMGARFMERLGEVADRCEGVRAVRGLGLMVGLVLDGPAAPLQQALQERGLLALATAGNVMRFLPPLNITAEQADRAAALVGEACSQLDRQPRETSS
jgi:predicted acetylornithine/succinylornithine family transaminase